MNSAYRVPPEPDVNPHLNREEHRTATASREICSNRVSDLMRTRRLPLFEIASVLVRLDHVARFIVNADRSITAFASPRRTE
jgi:hypothetical protein